MAIFFSELSGSATSTGSFGSVNIDTNISESSPLTVDGTSGRLFSVTDQMSGSVFSANLISGLPVIEAFSDNKVNIGPFNKPVKIGGDGSLTASGSIMAKGTYNSNATYIQINPFGSNPYIASATTTNSMKIMNLSGLMFERRNPDSNQFYRYHAYFEYSTGRSYFGGSTMIHSNGALLDGGDPKALLHVSGGNFYVEGGNISGSATSTGSFGMITTPSDIGGKPAARLHKFAFLRASDHGDNSALGFGSKSGNTIFGYDAGSQIVQNNGSGAANTYIGHFAGHGNATGDENTFIGHVAGGVGGSGDNNTVVGSYAGYNLSSGDDLVLIGKSAGVSITTMSDTVVIGKNAGDALTTGVGRNVAVGSGAMSALTTNTQNVAIGSSALGSATAVNNVIAIGHRAAVVLDHIDSSGTIAIGSKALEAANGSHGENIAIGNDAMKVHTSGGNNIAIGQNVMDDTDAGSTSSDSDDNLAIGKDSMGGTWANVKSEKNIAIGNYTMDSALNGANNNVAIGWSALSAITEGDSNTVVGHNSGLSITTGIRNVGLGLQTLDAVTTGTRNIAVGTNAGSTISTTSYNIFIGNDAGANATGTAALGIGHDALKAYTGTGAVAIGYEAGVNLTSGANQVSIGYQAGKALTTSANSVFIGYQAGLTHTGGNNVAIGDRAFHNTDAGSNSLASSKNVAVGNKALGGDHTNAAFQGTVALGYYALGNATMGGINYNIAIGMESQLANAGGQNVAIGYATLKVADGGETGNVAIGTSTMDAVNNDNSDSNVAVGNYSMRGGTGELDRNIAIGHQAMDGTGAVGGQQNIFIGDNAGGGSWTTAASNSNVAIGATAMSAALNGALGNTAIGHDGLKAVTTGDYNTTLGRGAGTAITTTSYTVAIGNYALSAITTTGDYTIAIGHGAMGGAQIGDGNIAIGYQSMQNANAAGFHRNTAVGYQTMANVGSNAITDNTVIGYHAGQDMTTANFNTLVGSEAGHNLTSGNNNVIIGYEAAGQNAGSYHSNVAIGYQAGRGFADAPGNVAIGFQSQYSNAHGDYNVSIGYQALRVTGLPNYAIAIGYKAGELALPYTVAYQKGYQIFIGSEAGQYVGASNLSYDNYNIFIGTGTGKWNRWAKNNTVVGHQGYGHGFGSVVHVSSSNITAFGYAAGQYTTGSQNTFVGSYAGQGGQTSAPFSSGQNNVAVGYQAFSSFTTGTNNTIVGREAGRDMTTGTGNTLLGNSAGDNITTADYNVAVGDGALAALTTDGDNNTAIGAFAAASLNNTGAIENVAIGAYAGTGGSGALKRSVAIGKNALNSTGTANIEGAIAIGYDALTAANNDAIDHCIAIGHSSLSQLTSGQVNIGIGFQSFNSTTTGMFNIGIGYGTGTFNITGTGNIYIGYQTGRGSYQAGSQGSNVGIGYQALYAVTTAQRNVAIGYRAGFDLLGAEDNVMVGQASGENITSGPRNTLLGHSTGDTITTGENNILIGYGADVDSTAGSNRIGIGYNVSVDTDNRTVIGVPNTDITTILGKVALHGASSDMAMFSHYANRNSSAAYALRQDSNGTTTVNAKTGYKILFGINNQYKMTVSGDNVGIGTTGPVQTLHVHSATTGANFIHVTNNSTGGGASDGMEFGINGSDGYVWNRENANIYFGTSDTSRMFISSAGRVGIGTTSPSQIFHVRDSANSMDMFSIRSTGSETRIGIGKSSADCAIDFSTALPNGGGTIQNTFRINFISNIRVGAHNGRLVLQSNNGIRIGAYNNNPSGNAYGLEVKHTRDSSNTGDKILNVMKSDDTSVMTVKASGATGIGTDAPTQKLDIQGSSSNGTIVQIRDTGDDYPVGVTYNHGVSGHHYAWYAGTMDGTSGERKFTIGTKVVNGFHNDLTTSAYSLLTLNQMNSSVSVINDLDVGGTYTNNTQPAFLAYNSVVDSNRSVDTDHKVEFNTEVYDQANNFDNSTDTFTAPVTGKYILSVQVRLDDIDKSANWVNTKIVTSNREYRRFIDPVGFDTNVDHFGMHMTVVADMDANDTAHVIVRQSGGSAILDIEPGNPTSQIDTFFSGYLLG